VKQVSVEFVARDQSAEVLQPTDRAFDFPATPIASQSSAILSGRLDSVAAMRADQLDAAPLQALTQWIAISSSIVDQVTRDSTKDSFYEQRLNECYFVRAGACRIGSEREALGVGKNHNLGALASLRLTDLMTPFFAEANVPSAKVSSLFTRPRRSRFRTNRVQAFSQMPASVHSRCRRQQVDVEGKCLGTSFHRAPLRSIHKMPSTQGRGDTAGRPPLRPTVGSGNKSAISDHCSSVSSKLGSILDPEGDSIATRDRFAMSDLLSVTPITANPT